MKLREIVLAAGLTLLGVGCATTYERRTIPERGLQFPIDKKSNDPAILQVLDKSNYQKLDYKEMSLYDQKK